MCGTAQTGGGAACILVRMSDPFTTDQFRILRHARDGVAAAAWVFRPKGYLRDVDMLVRERLITSCDGRLQLTPLGAAHLKMAPDSAQGNGATDVNRIGGEIDIARCQGASTP